MEMEIKAKSRRGISGSTLKLIAVITMFIDHLAAGVLSRCLSMRGGGGLNSENSSALLQWIGQNAELFGAYSTMRLIGRVSFPIYCFLLTEGFTHTKNRMKYAARMLIFAAVSEIPFDLLFNGKPLEFGYQNIFFTLYIGLIAILCLNWLEEQPRMHGLLKIILNFAVIIGCMYGADVLKTDYAAIGVLCIVIIYMFRKRKGLQLLAGCVAFSWELTAPLAFLPIGFYNGQRGWKLKYVFYLFYPVHLLLLYLLCVALGIASYPAL